MLKAQFWAEKVFCCGEYTWVSICNLGGLGLYSTQQGIVALTLYNKYSAERFLFVSNYHILVHGITAQRGFSLWLCAVLSDCRVVSLCTDLHSSNLGYREVSLWLFWVNQRCLFGTGHMEVSLWIIFCNCLGKVERFLSKIFLWNIPNNSRWQHQLMWTQLLLKV